MMAEVDSAIKRQFEGTPTLNNNIQQPFDFESWLQSNDLSVFKDLFIKHKMSTFESIAITNTHFPALISELASQPKVVENVIKSIQTLHTNIMITEVDDDEENNDSDYNEADETEQSFDPNPKTPQNFTEYIVVSMDEHKVLNTLKQSLLQMNKIKKELNETKNNYKNAKDQRQKHSNEHIEHCKAKINESFWKITQSLNDRKEHLLKDLDKMRIQQMNEQNDENNVIQTTFKEIESEINRHEKYLNDKMNEYKSLIEPTKARFDKLDKMDFGPKNDENKVKKRRKSIIKMGNHSKDLHQRQTKHIITQFEKIKKIINNPPLFTNFDIVFDENQFNEFCDFGLICENIPIPMVQNVVFESEQSDNLLIEMKEIEQNEKYQIIRYEVGYFFDDSSEEMNEISVLIRDDDEKSNDSSGSDLFLTHKQTEGGSDDDDEDDYKNMNESKKWIFSNIDSSQTMQIYIDSVPEFDDIYSKPPQFFIKVRILLMDKLKKCTFWSQFSDDFIIDFDQISIKNVKNRKKTYGTPQFLPKYDKTPNGFDEKMEEEDNDCLNKYYKPSVIAPKQRKESPLFNAPIAVLKEDNDEYKVSMVESKNKSKPKRKSRHKHSRSLSQKLSDLFGTNQKDPILVRQTNESLEEISKKNGLKKQKKRKKNQRTMSDGNYKLDKFQMNNNPLNDSFDELKEKRRKRKTTQIDILKSNNDEEDTFKILILGACDGGKSTIFKQFEHINGSGFDERRKKSFRILIFSQMIDSLIEIIEFIEDMEITSKKNEYFINLKDKNIIKLRNKLNANDILLHLKSQSKMKKIKECLTEIWILSGVQNVYNDKMNEIGNNVSESLCYFMGHIDRIFEAEYVPTMNDILLIRKRTMGINKAQIRLNYDNLCIDEKSVHKLQSVTICDVGGAPMERKKWKHHFVGVAAIIYVIGLSSFDEPSLFVDDGKTCKMKEEMAAFEQYINCNELKDKQWILMLNKIDLFVEKIKTKNKSIGICFDEYKGNENDVDEQSEFILKQFSAKNRTNKSLYIHITCAINEGFMKKVFDDVLHIIIDQSLGNESKCMH